MSCKVIKKSSLRGAPKMLAKGAVPKLGGLVLVDSEDGKNFTVMLRDSVGNVVDGSALATLSPAPSSSDPTIITVDPPTGMASAFHVVGTPPKLGTATVSVTVTANDGSFGPFSDSVAVTVAPGGPTGAQIIIGDPTVPPTP